MQHKRPHSNSRSRGRSDSRSRRESKHTRSNSWDSSKWESNIAQASLPPVVLSEFQDWMRELSGLLQHRRPSTIHIRDLDKVLPVPRSVLWHYGSVFNFLNKAPGLKCINGRVGLL
jgi:hypothetical protein